MHATASAVRLLCVTRKTNTLSGHSGGTNSAPARDRASSLSRLFCFAQATVEDCRRIVRESISKRSSTAVLLRGVRTRTAVRVIGVGEPRRRPEPNHVPSPGFALLSGLVHPRSSVPEGVAQVVVDFPLIGD
jgi:hypothetical protein